MRTFLDTSTLFKRYHEEPNSDVLEQRLTDVSEIIVSPTTYLELNNTVFRLYREKKVTQNHLKALLKEVNNDFQYFTIVVWTENLEQEGLQLMTRRQLKSLDVIQLASAKISRCDEFWTSDEQLYKASQKEMAKAAFI